MAKKITNLGKGAEAVRQVAHVARRVLKDRADVIELKRVLCYDERNAGRRAEGFGEFESLCDMLEEGGGWFDRDNAGATLERSEGFRDEILAVAGRCGFF